MVNGISSPQTMASQVLTSGWSSWLQKKPGENEWTLWIGICFGWWLMVYYSKWCLITIIIYQLCTINHQPNILMVFNYIWSPFIANNPIDVLYIYISGWCFQPLWKIWKSVGITIPNKWKNKEHLVVSTPLKNMKVSWDYYSQ